MALRIVFVLSLAANAPLLHVSTGAAVKATMAEGGRRLFDKTLVHVDTLFLGWIFPKGQLALAAQASSVFAPIAPAGMVITEILQLAYMSYYFWGNGFMVWMLWKVIRGDARLSFSHLRMFLNGWVVIYMITFLINFSVPAVSPRLYLHKEYNTPFPGLFLSRFLRSIIESGAGADPERPMSFGSFPSGHVMMTLYTAMATRRLGFVTYSKFVWLGTTLMFLAVLYLRFHYFVDALTTIPIVLFGLWVACLEEPVSEHPHHHEEVTPKRGSYSMVTPIIHVDHEEDELPL